MKRGSLTVFFFLNNNVYVAAVCVYVCVFIHGLDHYVIGLMMASLLLFHLLKDTYTMHTYTTSFVYSTITNG